MKPVSFFIDELGNANPRNEQSNVYILSGIMTSSQSREHLKVMADQIKFKYWGKTDIIFHSREIGRKEGVFKILKDKNRNNEFLKDLIKLLKRGGFRLFSVIVDKKKVPKNWNEIAVYKRTSEIIIKNFILSLLAQRGCRGKLVVESATAEKDFYYHKAAGHFLSNGIEELKINHKEVQNVLTEISFVTKKNFDTEEQIADILAYGLKIKYEKEKDKNLPRYEDNLIKVVNKKLFAIDPNTGEERKRLYKEIESFKVIP